MSAFLYISDPTHTVPRRNPTTSCTQTLEYRIEKVQDKGRKIWPRQPPFLLALLPEFLSLPNARSRPPRRIRRSGELPRDDV